MAPTLGYARVSTPDQSLDRQRDELTAAGCSTIYSDIGSGKQGADRPEWDQLLKALRKGDTLCVTELSRLGRSTGQLSSLVDELRDRGVALRILDANLDTGTAAGRLVFDVLAAVAQMERSLLIERTQSGLAAARARGKKGGRRRTLTDAQIARARKLYEQGEMTGAEIAAAVGTSRATLYRYLPKEGEK